MDNRLECEAMVQVMGEFQGVMSILQADLAS
jgi:hypothetical protein